MQKILVEIKESKIYFGCSGAFKESSLQDIYANQENIYRIQFSTVPDNSLLNDITDFLSINPQIDLRFYGNYSEDLINWELLKSIQGLFIDLWQTTDLNCLRDLKHLRRLGISKNVKSSVSLNIIENLDRLEMLFTSISKDIELISNLKNLRFISLNEIKTDNLDFLTKISNLSELWISLGSINKINGLSNIVGLKRLSIHQSKGFDNYIANKVLSDCNNLETLELMNLPNIEELDFVSNLKKLTTLNLEVLKNIKTYNYLSNCQSIRSFTGYNCRPANRSLSGLENIESIGLGDSYSKAEINSFMREFKGKNLLIRGKQLKGINNSGGRLSIL